MSIKITCIKKNGGFHESPYTAIESLGWINEVNNNNGMSTREAMYNWVNDGGIAYVYDGYGNKARITTSISPKGTKYVRTVPDNTPNDNLLKLPECY
jgi:hypothetical protein